MRVLLWSVRVNRFSLSPCGAQFVLRSLFKRELCKARLPRDVMFSRYIFLLLYVSFTHQSKTRMRKAKKCLGSNKVAVWSVTINVTAVIPQR